MSLTTVETAPAFTKLELRTAYGPVYRNVSLAPPRDCRPDEIPVIDLSAMNGDLAARKGLAAAIREASESTGFFYVKNHGIAEAVIQAALGQAHMFFNQLDEEKEKVTKDKSNHYNGWSQRNAQRASPSEALDQMEQFSWSYDPKYDPETKDLGAIPNEVKSCLQGEDFVWEGTQHIPGYKEDCLRYWQENLRLARRLLKLFALGLELPEDHFDSVTTYPGRLAIIPPLSCHKPSALDVNN